jgi:hypothetical protein
LPDIKFQGNPDEAYKWWAQMHATEWKHLIVAGGLADQPAALWADVMSIEFMHRQVQKVNKDRH